MGLPRCCRFNPQTDKLDLGWLSSSQVTVQEKNGSVGFSLASNNQTLTLTGVTLDELNLNNIIALDQSMQSVFNYDSGGDTSGGGGAGTVYTVGGNWNAHDVINFDPTKDTLDFGWKNSGEFSISKVDGSVVIKFTGLGIADGSRQLPAAPHHKNQAIWCSRWQ